MNGLGHSEPVYIHGERLERPFYGRDTLTVAQELLGKRILHEAGDGLTVGEIVETEAYIGPEDSASHAYQGRRTPRTEVQFGPAGYTYIYFIYGMYRCLDITSGPLGYPEVVFVRAARPIHGIDLMAWRRGIVSPRPLGEKEMRNLCNGPGKLCQAMGISRNHHGTDLCGDVLYLEEGTRIKADEIAVTRRMGLDHLGRAGGYPWRFCLYDCPEVSKAVFRDG